MNLYNTDIESKVIASLLDEDLPNLPTKQEVFNSISSDVFVDNELKTCYYVMFKMLEADIDINALNFMREAQNENLFDRCGGKKKLASLKKIFYSVDEIHNNKDLEFLKELYTRREMVRYSESIINKASKLDKDAIKLLEDYKTSLNDLTIKLFSGQKDTISSLDKITEDTINEVYERKEGEIVGLKSTVNDLSEKLNGYNKGDLIIIAGRPSMGKGVHMVNEAKTFAENGKTVLIFSLEMTKQQVAIRTMSNDLSIDSYQITQNYLSDGQKNQISEYKSKGFLKNIYVDSTTSLAAEEIKTRTLAFVNKLNQQGKKLDVIVVDYINLLKLSGNNANTALDTVAKIFKDMAKDLGVPFLLYCQLSREVEKRPDKRPLLSDIRDSGTIEQHADVVLFLYRPEYYGITEDNEGNSTQGIAEIIIAKNRNGKIGKVHCSMILKYMQMRNLEGEQNDNKIKVDSGNAIHDFNKVKDIPF